MAPTSKIHSALPERKKRRPNNCRLHNIYLQPFSRSHGYLGIYPFPVEIWWQIFDHIDPHILLHLVANVSYIRRVLLSYFEHNVLKSANRDALVRIALSSRAASHKAVALYRHVNNICTKCGENVGSTLHPFTYFGTDLLCFPCGQLEPKIKGDNLLTMQLETKIVDEDICHVPSFMYNSEDESHRYRLYHMRSARELTERVGAYYGPGGEKSPRWRRTWEKASQIFRKNLLNPQAVTNQRVEDEIRAVYKMPWRSSEQRENVDVDTTPFYFSIQRDSVDIIKDTAKNLNVEVKVGLYIPPDFLYSSYIPTLSLPPHFP